MTTKAREQMVSSATGGKRRWAVGADRGQLAAHWVATLVMMMRVATCIKPVIPAV